MDLIGEFHPKSSGYNCCTLPVYLQDIICIPFKSKVKIGCQAYIDNYYVKFGRSTCILSDKGTECNNKLFANLLSTHFQVDG